MIALCEPTQLDLDVDAIDSPTVIEIALLCEERDPTPDDSPAERPNREGQVMTEFECELVGAKLAELHAAGRVQLRAEGKWLVYEVSSEVCMTLLFLLLRHSSPPRRHSL